MNIAILVERDAPTIPILKTNKNSSQIIEYMKSKVEEIVKQKLQENFNDTKQVNSRVVTKEIIQELEKVMENENK